MTQATPTAITDPLEIRMRILNTLKVYPKLSPTMLQSGITPQISARHWHPILEALILEGIVERIFMSGESTSGRHRSLTILQLTQSYLDNLTNE